MTLLLEFFFIVSLPAATNIESRAREVGGERGEGHPVVEWKGGVRMLGFRKRAVSRKKVGDRSLRGKPGYF